MSYTLVPMHCCRKHTSGFTLLELSIVVIILSLLAATALRYASATTLSNNISTTNATMDVLETALMNYRATYNRLPCPAAIGSAENSAFFGLEEDNTAIASGNCTARTAGDNLSTTNAAAGSVPTKTLHIDDKYAYDAWGRRILYVVDTRITGNGSFNLYTVANSTIGTIVIKKTSTDTLANAIAQNGIYALISFGPNGHGAYPRNPSNALTTATTGSAGSSFNAGSTNVDEQQNCHCTSAAKFSGTTNYTLPDVIFVQKNTTPSSTAGAGFDDIVRFKNRSEMGIPTELQ